MPNPRGLSKVVTSVELSLVLFKVLRCACNACVWCSCVANESCSLIRRVFVYLLCVYIGRVRLAAYRLLGEMEVRRCMPTIVSYMAIIGACGQAGEWARALLALQDAWARRLSPDTISCNAAIAACEIVGQWEWALHLFGLVDQHVMKCDRQEHITHDAMINDGDPFPLVTDTFFSAMHPVPCDRSACPGCGWSRVEFVMWRCQ